MSSLRKAKRRVNWPGSGWFRVLRRISDHLCVLTIRAADNEHVQELQTTNEHPFWVDGHGWTRAGNLHPGTKLIQPDGQLATVLENTLASLPDGVAVHNFQVEDYGTYFVVQQNSQTPAIWVHNACQIVSSQGVPYAADVKVVLSRADFTAAERKVVNLRYEQAAELVESGFVEPQVGKQVPYSSAASQRYFENNLDWSSPAGRLIANPITFKLR